MNLANILEIHFKDLGYTVTTRNVKVVDGNPVPSAILGFPRPCIWFILSPFGNGGVFAYHNQVVMADGIRSPNRIRGMIPWFNDESFFWKPVGNINHPDFLKTLREFVNKSVKDGS